MKAVKIKMKPNSFMINGLKEIDQIYIVGSNQDGWYKKSDIYDHLVKYPASICVDIYPFPLLIPELSINGEKYVRSKPNNLGIDNLLSLPKEWS